ncbi:uncharacterized protein LOC105188476 [Harpegnathos saltator]|uniref:CHK kinase-like domain-containing protein n=1 Tax=Harpegnathos saltator TaxID=610380 RepID=E2C014_HARSA|nr:uncharacterized protein LOC105188476 [Harpegnathos saltator]EFN78710.1 hypothetical protein EAI_11330 [Harpegnathos saltator]
MGDEHQLKTIELRELQPLLRRTFDDRLIVVRYITKNLLPPGENYGSTILSVHAIIKRDDNADEEDLHLVAKMSPPTIYQRNIFDSPYTFRKEIFMYENIIPNYNQMERESGVKENQLFNILPKYYQSRMSLDPKVDFDDDAVILMENLTARGYYIGDRTKGYDLEHSKVAIRAMARFHALGMATKEKRPEYFEELKKRAKCLEFDTRDFKEIHMQILNKMQEDPVINVHIDRCTAVLSTAVDDTNSLFTAIPDEPWSSIIHSDFWVNNIMFHRDEEGHVDDIKFVDFQNYLFLSPVREMVFYLFSSTTDEVQRNHVEELIDLYHDTLTSVLEHMGCDTRPYSRKEFDAKLSSDAQLEFMHLCFMLKVLTLDAKETEFNYDKIKNVMHSYSGNQALLQRLRQIVLYFVEHDWI